jgi:hypothetical protein
MRSSSCIPEVLGRVYNRMEAHKSRDTLATLQLEAAIENLLAARAARELNARRHLWPRSRRGRARATTTSRADGA